MFFNFLHSILPINKIFASFIVGVISLTIVAVAGLNNHFIDSFTLAYRACYAFACSSAISFILFMFCEEYAIFYTKRDLINFIDDATFDVTDSFNPNDFFDSDVDFNVDDSQPSSDIDTFQPLNFNNSINNHS